MWSLKENVHDWSCFVQRRHGDSCGKRAWKRPKQCHDLCKIYLSWINRMIFIFNGKLFQCERELELFSFGFRELTAWSWCHKDIFIELNDIRDILPLLPHEYILYVCIIYYIHSILSLKAQRWSLCSGAAMNSGNSDWQSWMPSFICLACKWV